MDCLSARSPKQRVVFMKGAQVGATEGGNNWIGYVIDQAPGPMLAVQPTTETAKRNSKQRIAPLISECPTLNAKVSDPRSKDSSNTVLSKEFPGGVLAMVGANSAVGLRSMPARYLFLDEVDGYPGDLDGEGDPIALAEARTRTFARKKIFVVSTPTIAGQSRIEREYEASDKRRYFVPCPECGEFQTLEFKQIKWPKGKPREARYQCVECGASLGDEHKTRMLAQGEWRATAECDDKRTVGFHLSGLYSPVGWLSWVEIAQRWEAAQGNQSLLKEFINTVLGETWRETGEAPEWRRLMERREALQGIPEWGLLLSAGADVQRDRIEVSVWCWGRGKRSVLVEHHVLEGDTSRPEVWAELTAFVDHTWRHPNGIDIKLSRFAIDSGYATQEVYNWVRRQRPGLAMAIKGYDNASSAIISVTQVDVTDQGRRINKGVRLWSIGTSVLKSETYGWLRQDAPLPDEPIPTGWTSLPMWVDQEFCQQLCAEQLVTKIVKGYRKTEWHKLRDRNEALDCRVYARAATLAMGMDRFDESKWLELEHSVGIVQQPVAEQVETSHSAPSQPSPPPQQSKRQRRGGGWLGGRGSNWLRH
jgi:phage terminase large subunit GpA-like protein